MAGSSCASLDQDLLLYLYDDLPDGRRAEIEQHLGACSRCRAEMESLRATLGAVDRADLARMATFERPGAWNEISRQIRRAGRSGAGLRLLPASPLLKAAAVLLIVGASFIAGRHFDSLVSVTTRLVRQERGPALLRAPEGVPVPEDRISRLKLFSERTNGYLNRSRLVLLDFANADAAPDSDVLREASRTLLDENEAARRTAGQLDEPRLEELLVELEQILREISRLSDGSDLDTVDRIRAQVNNSGVLEQLEVLLAAPTRSPRDRART